MALSDKYFPKIETEPSAFAPALLRIQGRPPNPLGRKVLRVLLLLLAGLLLWSLLGRLDIVAVAEGKLVPQGYVKIVQPAEAGIVKRILVKEGEAVAAGQVLMHMDALISDADGKSLEAEIARKRLALGRIHAELTEAPLRTQASDPVALVQEVQAQYRANRAALEAALAEERARLAKARQDLGAAEQVRTKLSETLPHYREQEKAFDKLAKEGFAGPLMSSDKRRERIEKEQELRTQEHVIESAKAGIMQSEKRLVQIASDYRRALHTERNEVGGVLDKLTQEFEKQKHRRGLLELKAPQAAIVKDLATHTVGTVVQPGTVLLTLVPKDEALRAEVWVTNEDIGFVRPGQDVKLKFAAYPFQKYGMIEGRLEHVSVDAADPATNDGGAAAKAAGRAPPLVYKALVVPQKMNLGSADAPLALSAGMQTQAEILLGTRTVAEYLLSPVQKAWQEAGRER